MKTHRRQLYALALCLTITCIAAPRLHAQFVPSGFDVCLSFDLAQPDDIRSTLAEDWAGSDWSATSRTIHTYDSGNLVELVFQSRSEGAWVLEARYLQTFSGDQRQACTLQSWENGTWENSLRYSYEYDGTGNITRRLQELWSNSAWENFAQVTFTYDGSGRLAVELSEGWDPAAMDWVDNTRTTYTYDGSGQLIEELEEFPGGGGWIAQQRTTRTYDGSGNLTMEVLETRNFLLNQLVNFQRTTNTYDSGDRLIEEFIEAWDGSDWENSERTSFTYGGGSLVRASKSGHLPTVTVRETWTGAAWLNEARSELTYDGNDNLLELLDQAWDAGTSGWENDDRITLSYDDILPVELTSFVVAEEGNAARLIWGTASETNNAGFEVQRRVSTDGAFKAIGFVDGAGTTTAPQAYRFTDDTLPFGDAPITYRLRQVDFDGTTAYSPEVEFRRASPMRLVLHGNYPNPFRGQTLIRYELPQAGFVRMEVFNTLGQRVARLVEQNQPAGRNEVAFETHGLPSGVYFVRMEAGGRSLLRQMTVVQ